MLRHRTLHRVAGVFVACAGLALSHPGFAAIQGCAVAPPPLALPAQSDKSNLIADQANLQNTIAVARGNVRLEYDGQAMEAPYVRYNKATSQAAARDGLKYIRPGMYLTADHARVNVNNRTGVFDNAHYSVTANGGRGKAGKVVARNKDRFELTDADYTTCSGSLKAWQLSARHIRLDRVSGRGVARDAVMRFYGIPVLYTPYINFPIDDKRHTGVLPPLISVSGDSGFELTVPYYFNIAPNIDATLFPRVMSKRGFQLGAQTRYLFRHQKGELDGQYLPFDLKTKNSRSLVHFQHMGRFNSHVGIEADYNRVSDNQYFHDLSNDLTNTSTNQLERALRLTLADTGLRFTLMVQDFQTLDQTRNGRFDGTYSNVPYTRLPTAHLAMLSPTAPFQAGFDADFTNFRRHDSIEAYRIDARPRLLWGVDHGGWYADSEAAYRLTRYDLRGFGRNSNVTGFNNVRAPGQVLDPGQDTINRTIPSFRLGSGLRFSRAMHNGWIQTLEPRLQYLYVGYQNQSDIPVFDTGGANLHYSRLFADNRFVGIDRIGDANQITAGVTSRFIEPDSGRTVLKLDLGRVTGFRDLKVNLPGAGEIGYGDRGSDYVAGATFAPSDRINTDTILQYDPQSNRVNRALATARYGAPGGYRLGVGYRYYRDFRPQRDPTRFAGNFVDIVPGQYETLQQTVLDLRAPLTDGLTVLGRWNYSLEKNRNVETLAGIEYQPSCCWAGRVAWRHYVSDYDGNQDSAILFQFVLNGLGQFGDSVNTFVSKDVFSAYPSRRSSSSFDTIRMP